jgi:flagellar basal-body rod protein FlgB
MMQSLDILRMAQAYAAHAGLRQQAIAQNVANADTPGFRARQAVGFSEFLAATSAHSPRPGMLQPPPPRPETLIRPDRDAPTAPNGNSVSLEREMMRAAEARQQHEMALGIYSTVRDILRATISR